MSPPLQLPICLADWIGVFTVDLKFIDQVAALPQLVLNTTSQVLKLVVN